MLDYENYVFDVICEINYINCIDFLSTIVFYFLPHCANCFLAYPVDPKNEFLL